VLRCLVEVLEELVLKCACQFVDVDIMVDPGLRLFASARFDVLALLFECLRGRQLIRWHQSSIHYFNY
jgi:hypothetical protein